MMRRDQFCVSGKFIQGHSQDKDIGRDGFIGIAPVAKYPPNPYGLYDMAGNVLQWTSDWYRPDYYVQLTRAGGVARNPRAPETSFDPSEPDQPKKVHRDRSFLCIDQYCFRYNVGTRAKGEVNAHEPSRMSVCEGSEDGELASGLRMESLLTAIDTPSPKKTPAAS